jgi:hypothetical protein
MKSTSQKPMDYFDKLATYESLVSANIGFMICMFDIGHLICC